MEIVDPESLPKMRDEVARHAQVAEGLWVIRRNVQEGDENVMID